MKLNLNYRSRRFAPKLRVAPAKSRPSAETLQPLREAIEAEHASLRSARPHLLKLTLNEAEALALQTFCPHLVFPELAREKLGALATWHQRQTALRQPETSLAFAE